MEEKGTGYRKQITGNKKVSTNHTERISQSEKNKYKHIERYEWNFIKAQNSTI